MASRLIFPGLKSYIRRQSRTCTNFSFLVFFFFFPPLLNLILQIILILISERNERNRCIETESRDEKQKRKNKIWQLKFVFNIRYEIAPLNRRSVVHRVFKNREQDGFDRTNKRKIIQLTISAWKTVFLQQLYSPFSYYRYKSVRINRRFISIHGNIEFVQN